MSRDLRVSEVAKQLQVSDSAVRALISSGRLVAYNVAVSKLARPIFRITQEAVDNFRSANAVVAQEKPVRRRLKRPPSDVKTFF